MNEKMNILFVDDEPNIINGLKRMLHTLRNEWNMYFVESGAAALEVIKNQMINIIVTDMKMPQMDGAQLLSIVKEKYPGIIRIILSGYSEKEFIMKTTSSAHQFLAKPCKVETLTATINRLINLKKLVMSDELQKKIISLSNLPSLPVLYNELDKELHSQNVSIKRVSDIISQDIPMTAKILQMANSSFFGLPQKINDPVQAVNFLGMDTIKSLVLFHHLFSVFEHENAIQPFIEEIWNHSLRVAVGAKKLMAMKNSDNYLIEQTFAAGLLHDIGKLILIQLPAYKQKLIEIGQSSSKELRVCEQNIFGADHALIGGYLLGLWGLPNFMVESTAFHHTPIAMGYDEFTILSAIYIADSIDINENLDTEFLNMCGAKEEIQKYYEIVKEMEQKADA